MSGSHELVASILSCSRIVYYSDNIERKTLDKERILAPIIGIIDTNEIVSLFSIIDIGYSTTNLVVRRLDPEKMPKGMIEFDVLEITNDFDGPVLEIYDNYIINNACTRYLSSVEIHHKTKKCVLSISQDAPTLFEIDEN